LVAVFENADKSLQPAVASYHRAWRNRILSGVMLWVLTALLVVVLAFIRWWLGLLAFLIIVPLAAVAHFCGLWAIRTLFNRRFRADQLPSRSTHPQFAELLEKFCDDDIHPFFARNGIMEGVGIQIPESEMELLSALFHRRGFSENEPANWFYFLSACALRRDFTTFKQRIEYLQNAEVISAYANLFPNERSDRFNLPMLREILSQMGRSADYEQTMDQVTQYRKHFSLKAFSKDLEQRRSGHSINLAMHDVDRMNPFEFENLLGMIYEALGYRAQVTRKSGDQGADVILEKAGERLVVQAKLYSHHVGNDAVQEVSAARVHYRCHRAVVVTNNSFTRSAIELATSNNVELVDRIDLGRLLDQFNKLPKDYDRLAKMIVPAISPNEGIVEAIPAEPRAKLGNR
jgi:restriction system protein